MAHSAWNTKTSKSLNIEIALFCSFLVHGLIFCSFFFSYDNPIEPGLGIVDVDFTYPTQDTKNTAKAKTEGVKPKVNDGEKNKTESLANEVVNTGGQKISVWPKIIREKKVPYPVEAKKVGMQGIVSLKLTVDEQGRPQDIEVIDGPGHGLNEAAAEALKGFLFSPAYIEDKSVSVRIVYKYKFEIRAN